MFEGENLINVVQDTLGAKFLGEYADGNKIYEADDRYIHCVLNPDSMIAKAYPEANVPWMFMTKKNMPLLKFV
jgi:hypothetical protein